MSENPLTPGFSGVSEEDDFHYLISRDDGDPDTVRLILIVGRELRRSTSNFQLTRRDLRGLRKCIDDILNDRDGDGIHPDDVDANDS